MCPTTVVHLHVATAKDHGDFICHGNKPALLAPIKLGHAHLLVNVVSSNNRFNCE